MHLIYYNKFEVNTLGCFGCLFFPLELLFEAIFDGWFYLMELIIPEKYISHKLHSFLKFLVWTFCAILLCAMMVGGGASLSDDADTKQFGKQLLFVTLVISAVQILIGIIVRTVTKKKE